MRLVAAIVAATFSFAGPPPQSLMRPFRLHFEPNLGQADASVRFTVSARGMSIFLTESETLLARSGSEPVRMKLRGAKRAELEALDKLPGVSNYYRGNDPKKWREGVPHYARVRARSVYDGIDIVYYGNERRLEYDFVVAPGADPSRIELAYEGTRSMRVEKNGDLVLATSGGELRQKRPLVYQEVDGRRVEVAAQYRIGGSVVRFELAKYDIDRALVIDPVVDIGTFIGGGGRDWGQAIAVDASGAMYVSGYASQPAFPPSTPPEWQAFVIKLNPQGTAMQYSTYLGGSQYDILTGIDVDTAGRVYAAGWSRSPDFPLANPIQAQFNLGTGSNQSDGVVVHLGPSGALLSSTYLGGPGSDYLYAVKISGSGIYFAGQAGPGAFPQAVPANVTRGVLLRLSGAATSLDLVKTLDNASTFSSLALDSTGSIYVAGQTSGGLSTTPGAFQPAARGRTDAFAAKLSPDTSRWTFVTNIGGTSDDSANGIAVDGSGRVFVVGNTQSRDFPLRNAYDSVLSDPEELCCAEAFLTALNTDGSLAFSTLLGGGGWDTAFGVAVTELGIVVAGQTYSIDFPVNRAMKSILATPPPLSSRAGFVAAFDVAGGNRFVTLYGDNQVETAAVSSVVSGPDGGTYITGTTGPDPSIGMVSPGAYKAVPDYSDAFAARLGQGPGSVPVQFSTSPPGLMISVDGREFSAPVTVEWQFQTQHRVSAVSPQYQGESLFTFAGWPPGLSDTPQAPLGPAHFTIPFTETSCPFQLSPPAIRMASSGGSVGVDLRAPANCFWSLVRSPSWFSVGTSSVTGSATLHLAVRPNTGGPRWAAFKLGPVNLLVIQDGAAPVLPSPVFTTPASDGASVTGRNFQVAWSPITGALAYDIRIHQTTVSSPVYQGRIIGRDSTAFATDLPEGQHSILVRACRSASFADSECGSFAVRNVKVEPRKPARPPVLTRPREGERITVSTIEFAWEPVAGASRYEVVLEDKAASKTLLRISTPLPSSVFTMASSPSYELRVRACQDECSDAAAVANFSVALPSLASSSPTGLAAQFSNGNTLNLSWNPVSNADLYRAQIVQPNSGPGGGALTVAAKQVSTTSVALQVPAGAATVVLNACNGDGCGPAAMLPISPTGQNPDVPIVATPMPVVVAGGPNITISWSRIAGDNGSNTDYRLYVGDLSRDGPALDVLTKNNFHGAFLRAEGRRYDALVFATQNGRTVTGPASGFMVAGVSASAPLITSPAHNSTFKQAPFRLAWSPIPNAARYQYYVARPGEANPVLTGMTPALFVDTTITVTSSQLHHAIVRACPSTNANQCTLDSDAGWGPWSNIVTGTTNFTIVP